MILAPYLANTLLQRPLQTVHVWDIAAKTWFTQATTAERGLYPPDFANIYCSVVASAEDNSSHNIYILGRNVGGGGIWVFILTLPAFRWVPVYLSAEYHGSESKCLKIYEKHMVVYRGKDWDGCDYDHAMRFQGMGIYDMSSLTWTTEVRLKDQKYLVPEVLHAIIGGK